MLALSFIEGAACRKQFDAYRGELWNNQFTPLVASIATAEQNGTVTAEQYQLAVARLSNMLTMYQQNYTSNRELCGAEWIDSRFHDYYDPMANTLRIWQSRTGSALPVTITQPALPVNGNGLPGFSTPQFVFGASGGPDGEPYLPDWMVEREKETAQAGTGEAKPFPWGLMLVAGAAFLFLRKGKGK